MKKNLLYISIIIFLLVVIGALIFALIVIRNDIKSSLAKPAVQEISRSETQIPQETILFNQTEASNSESISALEESNINQNIEEKPHEYPEYLKYGIKPREARYYERE